MKRMSQSTSNNSPSSCRRRRGHKKPKVFNSQMFGLSSDEDSDTPTDHGPLTVTRPTGNTLVPPTPTQQSMATVSSGVCPESLEHTSKLDTQLMSLPMAMQDEIEVHGKGNHGTVTVRVQPLLNQSHEISSEVMKPLGFSFVPLIRPSHRRQSVDTRDTSDTKINFKRFHKTQPLFTRYRVQVTMTPTPSSCVAQATRGSVNRKPGLNLAGFTDSQENYVDSFAFD